MAWVHNRKSCKKNGNFRRFGVKEPPPLEIILARKGLGCTRPWLGHFCSGSAFTRASEPPVRSYSGVTPLYSTVRSHAGVTPFILLCDLMPVGRSVFCCLPYEHCHEMVKLHRAKQIAHRSTFFFVIGVQSRSGELTRATIKVHWGFLNLVA